MGVCFVRTITLPALSPGKKREDLQSRNLEGAAGALEHIIYWLRHESGSSLMAWTMSTEAISVTCVTNCPVHRTPSAIGRAMLLAYATSEQ